MRKLKSNCSHYNLSYRHKQDNSNNYLNSRTSTRILIERSRKKMMSSILCCPATLPQIGSIVIQPSTQFSLLLFQIVVNINYDYLLLVPLAIKNERLYKFIHRIVMKRGPLKKINNISSADSKNSLLLISSKKSLLTCWLLSIVAWSFEAVGIFLCFYAFGQNVPIGLSTLAGFFSALFGAI
jgi:hypothetical protein